MKSAARPAIVIVDALVLPKAKAGMIEQSATLSPSMPLTRSFHQSQRLDYPTSACRIENLARLFADWNQANLCAQTNIAPHAKPRASFNLRVTGVPNSKCRLDQTCIVGCFGVGAATFKGPSMP